MELKRSGEDLQGISQEENHRKLLHRIISYLGGIKVRLLSRFSSLSDVPIPLFCVLTFAADGAAMGPVSGVEPLVRLEAVRVPQRLPTVAAKEASPGVGEHVAAELRFLGERLVALSAGKRSLSAMDPQVTLQISWETHRWVDSQTGR